jgi:hypothetical protein
MSLWGNLAGADNLHRVEMLALPYTGPAGQGIFADGLANLLGQGYGNFVGWLDANTPSDTTAIAWPFDWRLSARDNGLSLALALETNAAAGNVNQIVSHSQGALVAWCAWAALVDRGTTAALSRWITFGGALYGTTSTPNVFREAEDSLSQLARAKSFIAGLGPRFYSDPIANTYGFFTAVFGATDTQVAELIALVRTWPGLYDLYPDRANLDDTKDLGRFLLFDPTKWIAALVMPDFNLLNASVASVHTPIRLPAYLPPNAVVSHIVGGAHSTPYRVQPATGPGQPLPGWQQWGLTDPNTTAGRLQRLPSFSETSLGDGRCTMGQQAFPTRYWQRVSSAHASMQDDPAVRALILSMLATPNPVPPTPNPISVTITEPWEPPVAPTGQPAFIFNNDPINITPPRPVLPVRIGGDP